MFWIQFDSNWIGPFFIIELFSFYLDLQPDEAMSRVLTESQCSGDEREIEWTIPVIGLSTHFSKALVINRDNWVGNPF